MTTQQRIERRLPELMAELAPARVPDYFDDMLGQVERTPQRPAWRSPERWLPMGAIARPAPLGLPSWRPLIILVLLAVATLAGALLVTGSRPVRLPPPYGPAANGTLLSSTPDGDIVTVDPASGRSTVLIGGATVDEGPQFAPDGTWFLFTRTIRGLDAFMAADADGGHVRELRPPGVMPDRLDISGSGTKVVFSGLPARNAVELVDTASGNSFTLTFPMTVDSAAFRPGHDQLVIDGGAGNEGGFWMTGLDGSGIRRLQTVGAVINQPALSPDGSLMAYTTWDDSAGGEGLLHVLDIESGRDRELARNPDLTRLSPRFSPDGTQLLVERYDRTDTYTLALLPIDGGTEVMLGAPHPQGTDGAAAMFSPDGSYVVATYHDDGSTWLLPVDGSAPVRADSLNGEMATWQRLAP